MYCAWTDKTITARDAVSLGAKILCDHFTLFTDLSDAIGGTVTVTGVLIIFDRLSDNSDAGVRDYYFTVVLLDRFRASSDIRASSVFQAGAALLELFPAEGRELGGCWVHPVDCVTASPDKDFAALALGLECRSGF